MKKLLVNKIICPDGTELVSRHRHDFQMHVQEDGREYFVDGGLAYQRVGASDDAFEDCSCYVGDGHAKIREHFTWTSVLDENEERLEKPIQRKLKDMSTNHIERVVKMISEDMGQPDDNVILAIFVDELLWRLDGLLWRLDKNLFEAASEASSNHLTELPDSVKSAEEFVQWARGFEK